MEKTENISEKNEENAKEKTLAARLSRLCLLAAAALLVYTCCVCCPKLTEQVRTHIGAAADSRAVQAFSSLTQALRDGDGVAEAFSDSYRVLSGGAY